jgi:hypothetical protein
LGSNEEVRYRQGGYDSATKKYTIGGYWVYDKNTGEPKRYVRSYETSRGPRQKTITIGKKTYKITPEGEPSQMGGSIRQSSRPAISGGFGGGAPFDEYLNTRRVGPSTRQASTGILMSPQSRSSSEVLGAPGVEPSGISPPQSHPDVLFGTAPSGAQRSGKSDMDSLFGVGQSHSGKSGMDGLFGVGGGRSGGVSPDDLFGIKRRRL